MTSDTPPTQPNGDAMTREQAANEWTAAFKTPLVPPTPPASERLREFVAGVLHGIDANYTDQYVDEKAAELSDLVAPVPVEVVEAAKRMRDRSTAWFEACDIETIDPDELQRVNDERNLARHILDRAGETDDDAVTPTSILQELIDDLQVPNSLGVSGSDFTTCLGCNGGSYPGKDGYVHGKGCPVEKAETALARLGIDRAGETDDGEKPVTPEFMKSVFGHELDPMQFDVTEEWWDRMLITVKFSTDAETITPIKRKRKMSEVTCGEFRQLLTAIGIDRAN